MIYFKACVSKKLSRLRRLRAEKGTREAARLMGISDGTLRKIISRGKVSPKMGERLEIAEERRAIEDEPARTTVPGYSPKKIERVLSDVRRMIGAQAALRQEARLTYKSLQSRRIGDAKLFQDLHTSWKRHLELERMARRVEARLSHTDSLERALKRVKNIDKQAPRLARIYDLPIRQIYILYYSPPSMGTTA